MADTPYTPEDLELFADLMRLSHSVGVTPYLIGAGAIALGGHFQWGVRLARKTNDWGFATRIDSWGAYGLLVEQLTQGTRPFAKTPLAHRLRHRSGGMLDLVPFGPIANVRGELTWPNKMVMSTRSLEALETQHEEHKLENATLLTASLPVLVGLKLLTYAERRHADTTRDIADAFTILTQIDDQESGADLSPALLAHVQNDAVLFAHCGSYRLGHRAGFAFQADARTRLLTLVEKLLDPQDRAFRDASKVHPMVTRARFRTTLLAFRFGLSDAGS